MKKRIVLFALVLVLAASSIIGVSAATEKSLQKKLNDIGKQIKGVQSEMNTIKKQAKNYTTEIEELVTQVNLTTLELQQVEMQLKSVEGKLEVTTGELNTAIAEADAHRELFDKRVRVMYMEGSTSYLDVILSSKSFSDFISRIDMVNKIIENDTKILDEMKEYKALVENKKAELLTQKKQIVSLKSSLTQKTVALNNSVTAKEAKVAEAAHDLDKLEAMEDSLFADSNAVSQEILEMQSSDTTYEGGGKMQWPFPGYKIGSDYGMRMHPILHKKKMHTGVDIGGKSGAKILAAESGTVIFAGVKGGYGNCVMVDHGGGIVTLYGHNSKLLVSKGDRVTRGQSISLCGSTGMSTGPHLHFEVRINGKYTDPKPYIK